MQATDEVVAPQRPDPSRLTTYFASRHTPALPNAFDKENNMMPSRPVDDWSPRWDSFYTFLHDPTAGGSGGATYLAERETAADGGREWSRVEWRDQVDAIAAGLAAQGLRQGDAVAVLGGNKPEALAVAFACWAYGYLYVPLNDHESDDRLEYILADSNAKVLVHCPPMGERGRRVGSAAGVSTTSAEELDGDACTLREPTGLGLEEAAVRIYTSGTTGHPKGVQLTVRNLLTNCDAMRRGMGWDSGTKVMVVLPIYHVNGLFVSCLHAWFVGASVVLCDRFRSQTFWHDAEAHQATVCSVVPTLLEFLIQEGSFSPPGSLREIYCAGGPLLLETVATFEREFNLPVRHLYGLSETTALATMMPKLEADVRGSWYGDHGFPSIGVAAAHVDVEVHSPDGRRSDAGRRGEIVVRGASVMKGYAGLPEANDEAFRGGWFHTGDEGFWKGGPDGRPFFFVSGRIKEIIIRGGTNISPITVDEVLRAHPAVHFGLAIPFENKFYGEEVGAYVVPGGPISEFEILSYCRERLDFALTPKVVIFGKEVPFTATGKPRRMGLKQLLAPHFAKYRDVQFRGSRD